MTDLLRKNIQQFFSEQSKIYCFASTLSLRLLKNLLQQGYTEQANWLPLTDNIPIKWSSNTCLLLSRPEFWLLAEHLAGRQADVKDWTAKILALKVSTNTSILWVEDLLLASGMSLAECLSEQQQMPHIALFQLGWQSAVCHDESYQKVLKQCESKVPQAFRQPFSQLLQYAIQKLQRNADTQHNENQLQLKFIAQLQDDVENLFVEKQKVRNTLVLETDTLLKTREELIQLQHKFQENVDENKHLSAEIQQSEQRLSEALKKQQQYETALQQQAALLCSEQALVTQLQNQLAQQQQHLQHSKQQQAAQQLYLSSLKIQYKKLQSSFWYRLEQKLKVFSPANKIERFQIQQNVKQLKDSMLFDAQWYVATYPDVSNAALEPELHYLLFGALEGRQPSAEFNGNTYLVNYPDVAVSGQNPLIHYLLYGRLEGRSYK